MTVPIYRIEIDVADGVTAPRLEELVRGLVKQANDGHYRGPGWQEQVRHWRLQAVAGQPPEQGPEQTAGSGHDLSNLERRVPTDTEVVAACNDLAEQFYRANGYLAPAGYKFYQATHPQERVAWDLAALAYSHIQGTDVADALTALE